MITSRQIPFPEILLDRAVCLELLEQCQLDVEQCEAVVCNLDKQLC